MAFCSEIDVKKRNIEEYLTYADYYLKNLEGLKSKAKTIAKINQEKMKMIKHKKHFTELKWEKLENELSEIKESSGLYNEEINLSSLFLSTESEVMGKINYLIYSITENVKLLKSNNQPPVPAVCQFYGKMGETLYKETISDKLTIHRVTIVPRKYDEYLCNAILPKDKKQLSISVDDESYMPFKSILNGTNDTDLFHNSCNINEIKRTKKVIDDILISYEIIDDVVSINRNKYDRSILVCKELSNRYCKNTYVYDNKVITRYITGECKLRDVVVEDLENDLRFSTFSEFAKLRHKYLIKNAQTCQSVYDSGFRWEFVSPVIKKGCKKENRDIMN